MLRRFLGLNMSHEPGTHIEEASGRAPAASAPSEDHADHNPDDLSGLPSQADIDRALEAAKPHIARVALERPYLVKDNGAETLDAMIAHLDRNLSAQLTQILHHPAFRDLESTWRGLFYLASNVEWDELLRLRAMNINRSELQSLLHDGPVKLRPGDRVSRALFEDVYQSPGGEPYGLLVLDEAVDNTPADINLLRALGQICAKAQTPLLAGVSPSLYSADRLATKRKSEPKNSDPLLSHPDWAALRRHKDSRYIGLCLPRVLGRLPYGNEAPSAGAFVLVEDVSFEDAAGFLWINSAFAMAANVGRSAKTYGWAVRIRGADGGGEVAGLPELALPTTDAPSNVMTPLDLLIDERLETKWAREGLISLLPRKGRAKPVFFGAQSLNTPDAGKIADPEEEARQVVLSRLPYVLCVSRYAHHVMRMAADWPEPIGEAFQQHVQDWLDRSVHPRPWELRPERRGAYPIQAASFTLTERNEHQQAELEILPGYQFEGLGVAIRLELTLPDQA
ncbi:type VI secretion system contractile sheath large subunit [uncultured Roseibium sp.]|uniref:type VI secretion system contractile sheath large subunit n=1 Tax=uncultured Roseibium sp. TaxID=1936171 RepID=UPI0026348467|nr:type VI secretion system contractile sheath large subunit [uncultured Roseibium sp.]